MFNNSRTSFLSYLITRNSMTTTKHASHSSTYKTCFTKNPFYKPKIKRINLSLKQPLSTGDTQGERESLNAASWFYNQHSIDKASEKASIRLTPLTILYSSVSGDKERDVLASAQYLHQELPIRIAKRIVNFRMLPFIVGCNPRILALHQLYIRTFHQINDHPPINSTEDATKFNQLLNILLDDHKDVATDLAIGFKEARKHIKNEETIQTFLDQMLTNRLSIRLLIIHHLRLQDDLIGHIGIINLRTSIGQVVRNNANYVQEMTRQNYGHAPLVKISGHNNAAFPYIEMPLDYILTELLKNAARATIENNPDKTGGDLPPIHVIVANNSQDFIVKVSDRGGGVPHSRLHNVVKYNFSTADEEPEEGGAIFGRMMGQLNRSTPAQMHGYGFGLPTSAAYARYLGGSLVLMPMQGLGTDVYLRLKHLDSKTHEIRI